jgi:metal-responsive CopG/Arc/MetJ family transcriptional regulator
VKTAISIPDVIFEEAERMAKSRGMSRSELYSNAVAEYVTSERYLGVRERLDSVYGGTDAQDSKLDPALVRLQSASLAGDDW